MDESTFYSLVQYFAICLFESADADDFSPAKILMNMSFTFYHIVNNKKKEDKDVATKQYLYECLKEQPIWRSLRFWTAAFFDAVQSERCKNLVPKSKRPLKMQTKEEIQEECSFQENITFGQLGSVFYH